MSRGQNRNHSGLVARCLELIVYLFTPASAKAEDGYRLWLRYETLPQRTIDAYRSHVTSLVVFGNSATFAALRLELAGGCAGLFGSPVRVASDVDCDGAV